MLNWYVSNKKKNPKTLAIAAVFAMNRLAGWTYDK